MMEAFTIDFETRSPVNIKKESYRRYVRHPATGILCFATQLLSERHAKVHLSNRGFVFQPGDPCPEEVLYALRNGIPFFAHNKPFDQRVWDHHCARVLGWPRIPEEQWHCTQAICSYYGLPRSLEKVCEILDLPIKKDKAGHLAMRALSSPRTSLRLDEIDEIVKARLIEAGEEVPVKKKDLRKLSKLAKDDPDFFRGLPWQWNEDPHKRAQCAAYCGTDVEAQTGLLKALGPLPADRLRDWRLDQEINERGVRFDLCGLLVSKGIIDEERMRVNARLCEITRDLTGTSHVTSVNQRDKILKYLSCIGVDLLGLTSDDVDTALSRADCQEGTVAREVLTLRASAGKASVGKLDSMLNYADEDGRARDALIWHKASTGRWAGAGWQPQNFIRDVLNDEELEVFHGILLNSRDPAADLMSAFKVKHRVEVFDIISRALRSFIVPSEGKKLIVSDFSAIEGRVSAWLIGCDKLLKIYYEGACVYSSFASEIYGREIKGKGPERQTGKVAILGLGYQMGENKFIDTAKKTPGVPDLSEIVTATMRNPYSGRIETSEVTKGKVIVELFRSTYPEYPRYWKKIQEDFITAVKTQSIVQCGRVSIGCNGRWAWIQLPSGRPLWYRDPQVKMERTQWGKDQETLSYYTIDAVTKKWVRRSSYGGMLLENITQGVAADLMIASMHRINAHPDYPVVLTVHDEVVSETVNGTAEEYNELMKQTPAWAAGCPVEAETHECYRYGK